MQVAPSGSLSHGWADSHQMWSFGWIQEGFSSEPAFTNVVPANAAASVNNGEPHCGQKRRITGSPEAPSASYAFVAPRISSDDVGTATLTEYPPPPAF